MAITVYKFPQPYLELELVAGGTLPIDDYYILGWYQRHGGYYHCAHSPCSEEQMITTSSGYQSIKVTWWSKHSDISDFSDAGGGQVTVTSVGHGLSNGNEVKIINTANYDGEYTISNVLTDSFEITVTFVSTETGKWLSEDGIPSYVTESFTGTSGICFKWDNTSMVMPVAGTPYKWLNNYPNESQDYTSTYGHRRWGQAYSGVSYRTGSSITWTNIGTSNSGLKDGAVHGSSYSSRGTGNMQVAHRNSNVSGGCLLDDSWGELDAKLHIKIDDTDVNNNWDDLVNALISSGYTDYFRLFNRGGHFNGLELIGNYDGDGVGIWTNINIVSSGGWRCSNITYNNCQVKWLPTQYQCRTSGDTCINGTFINSSFLYDGTSMDLYNYITADGFAPYGAMTFYQDCVGYTFNSGHGGYTAGKVSFQFRYPNYSTPYTMTDVTSNGLFCSITYTSRYPVNTIVVERYNAFNNGIASYDFSISYSYMDGRDCDFVWDLKDVVSDRDGGQIIVRFNALGDPSSYSDVWYSRYDINLIVKDTDGNPVEGATVILVGEETSSDTTDVNGEATVTQLGYTVTAPQGVSSGYGVNSDWFSSILVVSKTGWGTYRLEDVIIKEGKDWTIVLPENGTSTKIYDSSFYDSVIY